VTTAGDDISRQIAQFLHTLPDDKAEDVLQMLVGRGKAASGLPKRISEHDLLRSVLPPTQNPAEFELNIQHPTAYPTLVPLHVADIPLESLLGPYSLTLPRCANLSSISP
jgi:hypothetical protein